MSKIIHHRHLRQENETQHTAPELVPAICSYIKVFENVEKNEGEEEWAIRSIPQLFVAWGRGRGGEFNVCIREIWLVGWDLPNRAPTRRPIEVAADTVRRCLRTTRRMRRMRRWTTLQSWATARSRAPLADCGRKTRRGINVPLPERRPLLLTRHCNNIEQSQRQSFLFSWVVVALFRKDGVPLWEF